MIRSGAAVIAKDLQRQIRSGVLAPGQALPARPQLARHYRVARATIDRAIDMLTQSEVLSSRQGAGTWVRAILPGARLAVVGSALPAQDLAEGGARFTHFSYRHLASAAERRALRSFDGVLWYRPELEAVGWAEELRGLVPQVLINRMEPGFICVSTDHRSAYRQITGERLDRVPQARAYFLRRSVVPTLVSGYREAGFVDACRERQHFHEPIAMPADFAEALATLDSRLVLADQPVLVVSDNLSHTGAVMAWARRHGLHWQRDVWYSDFDNTYPDHVWGVTVTSFIQRETEVHAAAVSRLAALVEGKDTQAEHTLVQPERRIGDT